MTQASERDRRHPPDPVTCYFADHEEQEELSSESSGNTSPCWKLHQHITSNRTSHKVGSFAADIVQGILF